MRTDINKSIVSENNSFLESYSKACEKEKGNAHIYINVVSGQLSSLPNIDQMDTKIWKEVTLVKDSHNKLTVETLDLTELSDNVKQAVDSTFESLNKSDEQILKEHTGKIRDQKRVGEQDSVSAANVFSKLGIDSLDKTPTDLEKLVFDIAKARLEEKDPLTEREINDFYFAMYETSLRQPSESQHDHYHPAVIFKNLHEALEALKSGNSDLKMAGTAGDKFSGVNASYYLKGLEGQKLWIFKPEDGEFDPKKVNTSEAQKPEAAITPGIAPGEGAKREHVACLLNYDRQFPIPYTAYVKIGDQVGSVQAFIPGCVKLTELAVDATGKKMGAVSKDDLHSLLIYDVKYSNCDRHLGNVLTEDNLEGAVKSFGIDHGASLPNSSEAQLKIEFVNYPQMHTEFSEGCKKIILDSQVSKDTEILQKHHIGEGATNKMVNSTLFLQTCVKLSNMSKEEHGVIITPFDIGMVALRHGDKLYEPDDDGQIEKFAKDIIEMKKEIKSIVESGGAVSGKIMRIKLGFSKRPTSDPSWTKTLFEDIIPAYKTQLESQK